MSRAWCVALVLAGCTGGGDEPKPPPPPPPAAPLLDAGALELPAHGTFDPASGRHLDDDAPATFVPPPRERTGRAPQRPIDLTLRSLPPGAMAAVDGVQIGLTPTYWSGDANGRVHEFTFVAPHYSVARYRFVPVTSGILYARLDSVAGEDVPADASVPPIPLAAPELAPPAPPPTVVSPPRPPARPPVDAAVASSPPAGNAAPAPADAAAVLDPITGEPMRVGPLP
jgi:hypothetical protein